jgi:hypothetical protein
MNVPGFQSSRVKEIVREPDQILRYSSLAVPLPASRDRLAADRRATASGTEVCMSPQFMSSLSASLKVVVLVSAFMVAACESRPAPLSPTPLGSAGATLAAGQSQERCVNAFAEGTASLGLVTLPNGTFGFGGLWFPITLGGLNGEMASVVTHQETAGADGATHLTLEHAFRTADGDYFMTRDRAVCAPAGNNPATCRVNDVLTIVDGTGIFTNAHGSLRNHGVIDFVQGTLEFSIRGRVCGDGV